MNFPDDFEVVDAKLIGKKSNEYAVHDRYITCRQCSVRRPADKLKVKHGVPICWDHGSGESNVDAKVQQVPVVPVEMHMPTGQSGYCQLGVQNDSPACKTCGDITFRSGSCYACRNCGSTSGCS